MLGWSSSLQIDLLAQCEYQRALETKAGSGERQNTGWLNRRRVHSHSNLQEQAGKGGAARNHPSTWVAKLRMSFGTQCRHRLDTRRVSSGNGGS